MSTPVEADLQQYGAISPLAIGALLLGLASILALFSMLLLIVPVVTVLVALLALRQIANSDGAIIGRLPAAIGLLGALLFASIAVSSVISRNRTLEHQAVAFATDWIELVREGELHRAHQLHLPAADRQLPGSSLTLYYQANEQAKEEFDRFFAQPLVETIRNLSADTKLQGAVVETTVYDELEQIAVRYRSVGGEVDFVVVVERAPTQTGGIWRITQISGPKPQP